jgi:hypothetical protein
MRRKITKYLSAIAVSPRGSGETVAESLPDNNFSLSPTVF